MVAAYQSSAGRSESLGNDPTVTKPAGTVSGDLLIAVGNGTDVITAPAGWTTHAASLGTTTPLWTKIAGGSEPASYTFVAANIGTSVVAIVRVTGHNPTTPIDTATGVNGGGNLVIPTLNSGGANRLLLQIVVKQNNNTWTAPGTATERADVVTASASFSFAVGDETVGAGATGSRTWTPSGGGGGGTGYMLAIAPATVVHNVTGDLGGDGVLARVVDVAMSEPVTGDGVVSRAVAGAMTEDMVGDGVVSRGLAAAMSEDLTGDGTITRALAVTVNRDVTGDGTITETEGAAYGRSFDLTGDGVTDATKATVASKSFNLTGDGVVTESHSGALSRTFDLTGDGVISGSADIPFPVIPECPPDWSPNDGLKSIAGDVFFHEPPNEGDPVAGADVCLIRDSDGLRVDCTTTDGTGHYSFPRDSNDPYTYHVEVRYADQQGLSEGGCVPV